MRGDSAGQERYRAITTSHYRRAAGALLVYDVTNRKSFDNAKEIWFPEFLKSTEDRATMLQCVSVVGNKIDLDNQIQIALSEHDRATADMGLTLSARTSARTGQNVEAAFADLLIRVYTLRKGTGRRSMLHTKPHKHKTAQKSSCC